MIDDLKYSLTPLEIRVLEEFYLREDITLSLKQLYLSLKKKYHIQETSATVRNKVIKLSKLKMLYIIPKTSPMIIEQSNGIRDMARELVIIMKERYKIM